MDKTMMASLAGLDEGLRVRHIAASPLSSCCATDDPEEILERAEFEGFKDGDRIVAILERAKPPRRRPLDDSVLVSADAPLFHFIHTVHEQSYRLVVDQTAITGIVTWSDLLKLPVLVLAFSLVAELERAMNWKIRERYAGNEWLKLLDDDEQNKISGRQRKLERENLVLPTIELADIAHKAKVLRTMLAAGRKDFEADLKNVVRNDVDHVKEIVRSDADLKGFVERLETAEAWLEILKSSEAMAATAGP